MSYYGGKIEIENKYLIFSDHLFCIKINYEENLNIFSEH